VWPVPFSFPSGTGLFLGTPMTAAELTPATPDADETESKRLLPAQWEEIKELWELGTVNLADLSNRFGISKQAIHKGLKKRGVVYGSRRHEVGKRIAEEATKAAATAGAEFVAKRRSLIDQAKTNYLKSNNFIMLQTMQLLQDAKAKAHAFGTLNADLNALQQAAKILTATRKETYTILEVEEDVDETQLPKLIVEDLTEDEIFQIQSADADDELDIPESADPEVEAPELVIEGDDGGG
jgi:hypothetical protein